jgi:hypothetical protein
MTRAYTPRRQSARWLDADCPRGVLAIYDDPRFIDRFTVIYADTYGEDDPRGPYLWGRGMSAYPSHPQGVGMSFEYPARQVAQYRYRERNRAARWSDLPEAVKACVRQDLADAQVSS